MFYFWIIAIVFLWVSYAWPILVYYANETKPDWAVLGIALLGGPLIFVFFMVKFYQRVTAGKPLFHYQKSWFVAMVMDQNNNHCGEFRANKKIGFGEPFTKKTNTIVWNYACQWPKPRGTP
jgi:hypothetical protein